MQAIEYVPIADVYADDLSHVEICGPNVRFVFCIEAAGGERVVVAKIVRPLATVRFANIGNMIEAAKGAALHVLGYGMH
jgi:hypothetical protein